MKLVVMAMMIFAAAPVALGGEPAAAPALPALQDYFKPGQLEPLPEGMASLYRVPWRSNVQTALARDAFNGVGVYYKHVPPWTIEENTLVMKQMAQAGVKRMRIAPHLAMSVSPKWTGPSPDEAKGLKSELTGCKKAGIRPCVIFVHLPPMGTQESFQKWVDQTHPWKKDWMPQGVVGSPEYDAINEKNWIAMEFMLKTAREAGFTKAGSYDMEMGQNIWWGFPALQPNPALTLKDLQPGGLVYESDKALVDRARKAGYVEPNLLCGQSYHYFDKMSDQELPQAEAGRAISFYSQFAGVTDDQSLNDPKKPFGSDAWPARPALKYAEGKPPVVTLVKPEGFMADFSRRDCLISMLKSGKFPVAITSLGVVPSDIPSAMVDKKEGEKTVKVKAEGVDGFLLKSKGLTRSLAFWLNQGASFVLIHSAYERGNAEMSHALIPDIADVKAFKWQDSRPLTTMKAFVEPLRTGQKLDKLTDLKFKYALADDAELIPASEKGGPLKASDAVALLSFQISKKKFAVAAYVVTPTITVPYKPTKMTLQVDKKVRGDVATSNPVSGATGKATIVEKTEAATTMTFDVTDDVTWLVFQIN